MSIPEKSEHFVSVIEANKGIIYKVVNSYCKNEVERKDLVQEIVMQLWKSFDNYNEAFRHSTWIYRIALNVSISFYRKEVRRHKIHSPFSENIFNVIEIQYDSDIDGDLILLKSLISGLTDFDKAMVLLYLDQKSHKEISEITGITETNVATKIARIKALLKHKFSQLKNSSDGRY